MFSRKKSSKSLGKRELKMKKDFSDESEEQVTSGEEEDTPWIVWFSSLPGNEFFCEVDEDYIQDDFNLTGLRSQIPNYDFALDVILDTETDDSLSEEQTHVIETAAEFLYGLIHARYVLTSKGMLKMVRKFQKIEFGRCPRVLCGGQPVLPVGQTDIPRTNTVKIFCPKCQDIYYPRMHRHTNVDGAYFGTTFPHLLLQTYPDCQPAPTKIQYVPKIYGFKIHPSARERQREMQLLRAKQQRAQQQKREALQKKKKAK